MKQIYFVPLHTMKNVTPFVGVWIETFEGKTVGQQCMVTPFVGVWIET